MNFDEAILYLLRNKEKQLTFLNKTKLVQFYYFDNDIKYMLFLSSKESPNGYWLTPLEFKEYYSNEIFEIID